MTDATEASPTVGRLRLVGYLRVSTDRQAEHGLGLDVQEAAIRKWARAGGHRVVAWYRDEGESGSNGLETRVALAEALATIREQKAAGVVVYRLDRLARDLVLQEQLLAEVRRMGGDVFSTSAAEASVLADDPADPSRKLIRQVLGAVAEYERAMIVLRMRSGRSRKRETGYAGDGPPPLGYRAEGRQLVRDDEEQVTLARIAALRASGASLRAICAVLSAEGRTTKRGGTGWYPETLRLIIDRLDRR
jgi:DNA invertase Pin-like site-specific DNA recombinase